MCVCVCYHGRGSEQPAGTPTGSLKPLYSTTLPCMGIHRIKSLHLVLHTVFHYLKHYNNLCTGLHFLCTNQFLAGRCYEAEICAILFPLDALSDGILVCRSQNFQILAKNHGL